MVISMYVGDSLTTLTFAVKFACILKFRIATFIRYTQVYLCIIFWFENQQRTVWNFYAFLCQFNNEMSLPSHTGIYLQKNKLIKLFAYKDSENVTKVLV